MVVWGGGVGVEEMIAGDLLGGAGEGICLSNFLTAPLLGSLITMPALFRAGIWKLDDFGAGLFAPRLVVTVWLGAGVIGVCGGPKLDAGRSETAEEVRDIAGG